MDSLKRFKIDERIYVLADELKQKRYPNFMISLRSTRQLIADFNIKEKYYLFATVEENDILKERSKEYKKAKVFLRTGWIKTRLPKDDTYDYQAWLKARREHKNPETELANREKPIPLLIVDEKEMFHDKDGNCLDIEMRGTRSADNCYFRLNDVAKEFGIERLHDIVINNITSSYTEGKDYKKLNRDNTIINGVVTNKKDNEKTRHKEVFLTYVGLLRVLFTTKNGLTEPFTYWATQVLFTAQLGTKSQRLDLCSSIMGVNRSVLKSVLSKTSYKFSCVYLMKIEKVEDFSPPEGHSLYKYGRTDDLDRRMSEHAKRYCKNITLIRFAVIDDIFNAEAEACMRKYFNEKKYSIESKGNIELVCLDDSALKDTVKEYNSIQKEYAGKYQLIANELAQNLKVMGFKDAIISSKDDTIVSDRDTRDALIKSLSDKDKIISLLEEKLKKYKKTHLSTDDL